MADLAVVPNTGTLFPLLHNAFVAYTHCIWGANVLEELMRLVLLASCDVFLVYIRGHFTELLRLLLLVV